MNKASLQILPGFFFVLLLHASACNDNKTAPGLNTIAELNLKRGEVISCSPAGQQFGSIKFDITGSPAVKTDFHLAVKLLHSFEYDEAEKVFAKIIDKDPNCAMAYWGVAMSNFHPLWAPPSEAELIKGTKAVEIAKSINQKSKEEEGYISAIAAYYNNWQKTDHLSRCLNFERAMAELSGKYPANKEATIFYALALTAAADPADKTFIKQKKAGALLNNLYAGQPNHPGIVHYIIHTYDSPGLAELALPAARKYASVAPSSAHALHMPSHIFTRLGLWSECINSNLAAVASAQCYAQEANIKGHWDEELHGLDYLVYGYLQKGDNAMAKKQWNYLKTITEVSPFNFKVVYAFASIPSRYVLENRLWKEAASLTLHKDDFDWKTFQWQKAILHFTRALGALNTNDIKSGIHELQELNNIRQNLLQQKNAYQAGQVAVQIKAVEAWLKFKEGKTDEAIGLMTASAKLEDETEKHPVTPSEVLPAKELLGDLLMQMNKPAEALQAYEENLKKHPNRFNGLYGAGLAAHKSGDIEKAKSYYKKLLSITDPKASGRAELKKIAAFIKTS